MLPFIISFLLSTPLLSISTTHASIQTKDLQRRCNSAALNLASDPAISSLNVGFSAVEFVPAGTTLVLGASYNHVSCNRPSQLVGVDICRLSAYVPTSVTGRSGVNFELWMPAGWVGEGKKRFLGTGNGGIDGCKLFFY